MLLAAVAGAQLAAAQISYSVFTLDTSMIRNANIIVRTEEEQFELKSIDKAVHKVKRAVTILNENGDQHAALYVPYDKFTSVDYIEGALYDAYGKKIKSVKKSGIRDMSGGNDGMSLAVDNRYKEHNFYHKVYPYTVEYEYSTITSQTMFFPSWFPLAAGLCSVEESSMSITVPAAYKLRYKAFNYDKQPDIQPKGDKTTYVWSIKKLPAVVPAFAFPGWRYVTPMVILAPTEFQIEDYKGTMTDWAELGKFQLSLNQGRDALPDAIKQEVQQLVSGKATAAEKVEALYGFLQRNTRYISIQLGVGGWRPFEAAYVAKNRYGDCKALSNYMYSLLKEAGIPSYYTLIRAGSNSEDIVADFPSRQFNHAILCVPLGQDTMWLECTSQDQVPGYMGGFTGNRDALLITPEGGKLVRTPSYGIKENQQHTRVKAVMDENGNLSLHQSAYYAGMRQDLYHDLMNSMSKEKVKAFLSGHINLPTYDIEDFNYTQERKRVPVVHEQLKLLVSSYAQVSGRRVFIVPNITNRSGLKLTAYDRKYPFKLNEAYLESDTVEIAVPGGYKIEAMPPNVRAESQFGKYSGTYKFEGDKLMYYRTLECYRGLFDQSLYGELVKFYDAIYKGDRSRVVLVKE